MYFFKLQVVHPVVTLPLSTLHPGFPLCNLIPSSRICCKCIKCA